MENNEVIIFRGKGKKEVFNDVNSVSVIGDKVILRGEKLLKRIKVPRKFNILLNGGIGSLEVPLEDANRKKIKRLLAGSRSYGMEINGLLPKLSFKDSNIKVGISLENNEDLLNNYISREGRDSDLFFKFMVKATGIYESLIKGISKETKLVEVKKKVSNILELLLKADMTFTSFNFAPYLNTIISSLQSILSKCDTSPYKKVSCIWFDNMMIKHYISKIVNSKHFRHILNIGTVA